jgi:inner membrane protein
VAVVVGAAAASRRHRAVLAGVAAGLLLHFARDIATGPGVKMLWPLQETAWAASYWWFLGMIIVCTSVRLVWVRVSSFSMRPPPLIQLLRPRSTA